MIKYNRRKGDQFYPQSCVTSFMDVPKQARSSRIFCAFAECDVVTVAFRTPHKFAFTLHLVNVM